MTVSIASTSAATQKVWVQRREQQRPFKDVVPIAFPADFERYEHSVLEALSTMEWTRNFLLPQGACEEEQDET